MAHDMESIMTEAVNHVLQEADILSVSLHEGSDRLARILRSARDQANLLTAAQGTQQPYFEERKADAGARVSIESPHHKAIENDTPINGSMRQLSSTSLETPGASHHRTSTHRLMNEWSAHDHFLTTCQSVFGERPWVSKLYKCTRWFANLQEPARSGWLFKVVNSPLFKAVCTSVIIFNAGVASVATEYEMQNVHAPVPEWIGRVEVFFVVFYSMELCLKLVVHRVFFFINGEARWNNFDLVLVFLGFYDFIMTSFQLTGGANLTFARLGRLLKLSRLLRVFRAVRFFSALRQMLASIVQSMAMLFWAMTVLLLLWWTLGLVLLQGLSPVLRMSDVDDETKSAIAYRFGTINRAIFTLFSVSTGGDDWEGTYNLVAMAGDFYALMLLLYISFFTISLFNILTGIVVEAVVINAKVDDSDRASSYRRKMLHQGAELKKLFAKIDSDGSGVISEAEMVQAMEDHEILALMEECEVDPRDAITCYQMLCGASSDSSDPCVDVGQFIDGFMQMKGTAQAIDIQMLRCQGDNILKTLDKINGNVKRNRKEVVENRNEMMRVKKLVERGHTGPLDSQVQRIMEEFRPHDSLLGIKAKL